MKKNQLSQLKMPVNEYHERIIRYYRETENAYKDSWDLDRSLSIHYGYWDEKVNSFAGSLLRMNEVMMEMAAVYPGETVLDAGCGVGGSSIFLGEKGCEVTGITLSPRQVEQAQQNARERNMHPHVRFLKMDYCQTDFPDNHFDIVWGCESICYAENKEVFIREAFRLLRPGGRLVVADGFVTEFSNNQHPVIRNWLKGWEVNYLETPDRFIAFMANAGFMQTRYRNISAFARNSSRRLYRFYFLAKLYLLWKTIILSNEATPMQKANIQACKYQYHGMRKGLWQYGIITGQKP